MKKFFEEISIIREIILFAITAIIFTVLYLLILPALWGWGFWGIVMLSCLPAGIYGLFLRFSYGYEDEHSIVSWLTTTTIACTIVVMLVLWIGGGAMVQPITTANSHTYETVETTENLPTEEDIQNLILMDTASATKLGDRAVGSLSEYVSQYEVSMQYTTISYNGKSYKIAPLAHGSYFKAMQNETIPGYVLVDASAGADLNSNKKQEFIKVEGGIKYSPSAYFSKDLFRHVRSKYKTEVIRRDYYNFQIDDEGTPYWVLTVYDYAVWASCPVPYEAILVNAVNGDMEKYKLADLPLWVDQAVNGDAASEMYNRYGSFNNGFWNSLFAKKGCTQTTDDYGYVNIDNCIYTYTGVTSVGSDESNIGFMLSNTRTGVSKYYPNMAFSEDNSDNEITGAEEYSAMGNAESAVQNYGYKASFPTLAIIDGVPTYVMVLKGDNGLVKKYAMVNYIDYSILAVEDDIQECLKSYQRAINKTGAVVSDIEFVIVNGETIVYIKTSDGKVYKERFAENESLITISKDDKVNIEVSTPDTEIPFAHITK